MEESGVFDPVAAAYDQTFTDTEIGKRQREQVFAALEPSISTSSPLNILELNCGTGADAIRLARQYGHSVLPTDASAEMLLALRKKLSPEEFQTPLAGKQVAFEKIGETFVEQQFDLVFSNFGGLNCVDEAGLRQLATDLAKLVRPGGKLVFVIMAPWTLWEWLYFSLKFRFRRAFARAGRGSVQVPLGDGVFQESWYPSPRRLARAFSPHFQRVEQRAIGLWVPPGYLEPFFANRIKWLDRFQRWDAAWGKVGRLAGFGDHYLMVLEKN